MSNETPLDEAQNTALRCRQLERERNALLAIAILIFCIATLQRIGQRVYAISVWDPTRGEFVERAYLPQRAQAEEVLATLTENARKRHPFYRSAPVDFQEAEPGFQEPVAIRRVRRTVPLPAGKSGADLPVQRAVQGLTPVLHVQVKAVSLFDAEKDRPLVVLPSEGMVEEAKDTRLDNVGRKVSQDIKAPDYLVEAPAFLQKVATRHVVWPVDKVLTVAQAVDYLTHGEAPAMHVVQAGESLAAIAAKYGARVSDLAEWNPGRALNMLRAGDKLVVRRPEAPLTVLTVERRVIREMVDGRRTGHKVTVEIRRHDGQQKAKTVVGREPVR
ncbi:MAG: LysM peptidoglycan-binding domain-containing protein [Armatimonadetes bacterium]|nr:LysM peptidoglycan-binding domain-containing protein [Armatimonadota bacterium]